MADLHPLQFKTFTNAENPPKHVIEAYSGDNPEPVGSMKWHSEKVHKEHGTGREIHGMIADVTVQRNLERHGIATAMWNHAHSSDIEPKPAHSISRTPQGNAWAKKVGGRRPMTAAQFALNMTGLNPEQFR